MLGQSEQNLGRGRVSVPGLFLFFSTPPHPHRDPTPNALRSLFLIVHGYCVGPPADAGLQEMVSIFICATGTHSLVFPLDLLEGPNGSPDKGVWEC